MKTMVKKVLISLVIGIFVVVFGYGGYYVYSIIKFTQDIGNNDSALHDHEKNLLEQNPNTYIPDEPPEWTGTERVNILLLGGDARGVAKNEAPRSDTIMVASVDPQTKQAQLFSIMRDTYTDIPGHYKTRVNAALALGGPKLAMETVGNLLGIDIQYYVFVDFQGFIDLIDAIGGIEFEVEKDMYYYDPTDPEYAINLKKGLQVLDGDKALQYVRFRYDRMGDYTRTERQRALLSAVANKITTMETLFTLPGTLNKIKDDVTTNIPADKMLSLARLAYESSKNGIATEQLPPMNLLREQNIDGADVIVVDVNALHQYVEELFAREPEQQAEDSETNQAADVKIAEQDDNPSAA